MATDSKTKTGTTGTTGTTGNSTTDAAPSTVSVSTTGTTSPAASTARSAASVTSNARSENAVRSTTVSVDADSSSKPNGSGGFTETLEQTKDRVVTKFKDVSREVKQGAERAGQEVTKGYGRASEAAREGYQSASQGLKQGYGRLSEDLGTATTNVNSYVRQNPGKAVLMATGVGFLIGLLARKAGSSNG